MEAIGTVKSCIGKALGGCNINWPIISMHVFCKFVTGGVPRGTFRGHGSQRITTLSWCRNGYLFHIFHWTFFYKLKYIISADAFIPNNSIFLIKLCNIWALNSKINAVHQHLQTLRPHKLVLRERQLNQYQILSRYIVA